MQVVKSFFGMLACFVYLNSSPDNGKRHRKEKKKKSHVIGCCCTVLIDRESESGGCGCMYLFVSRHCTCVHTTSTHLTGLRRGKRAAEYVTVTARWVFVPSPKRAGAHAAGRPWSCFGTTSSGFFFVRARGNQKKFMDNADAPAPTSTTQHTRLPVPTERGRVSSSRPGGHCPLHFQASPVVGQGLHRHPRAPPLERAWYE